MARPVANVVIATDSFVSWVGITNQMADTFTRYTLTANNSTIGANVSGNSQLWGTFSANTVAVGDSLRGGIVNASANLNIVSNAIFTGATINATSNVNITTTNTYINSTFTYVVGGIANVTSNVSIVNANTYVNSVAHYIAGGIANVTSNVSIVNANTYVNSSVMYVAGVLTNITSNVSITAANVTGNVVNFNIRGGTFTVDSNVAITNTVNIANNLTLGGTAHTVAGNVTFNANTLFVDATNGRVGFKNTTPDATVTITGTANVSGPVLLANTLGVTGLATFASSNTATANVTTLNSANSNLTGNTTVMTDVVLTVASNTNIGFANSTGTFTPVEVFSFPTATYTGAKVTAKIVTASGANTQIQELLFVQNTTDVISTMYGTVVTGSATSNLGAFTASINTTAVSIKFQQTTANTSVKMFVQLIK